MLPATNWFIVEMLAKCEFNHSSLRGRHPMCTRHRNSLLSGSVIQDRVVCHTVLVAAEIGLQSLWCDLYNDN